MKVKVLIPSQTSTRLTYLYPTDEIFLEPIMNVRQLKNLYDHNFNHMIYIFFPFYCMSKLHDLLNNHVNHINHLMNHIF